MKKRRRKKQGSRKGAGEPERPVAAEVPRLPEPEAEEEAFFEQVAEPDNEDASIDAAPPNSDDLDLDVFIEPAGAPDSPASAPELATSAPSSEEAPSREVAQDGPAQVDQRGQLSATPLGEAVEGSTAEAELPESTTTGTPPPTEPVFDPLAEDPRQLLLSRDFEPEVAEPMDDSAPEPDTSDGPRLVVALASGKGGVGKSVLASSIAIYLAQLGRRVILADGALGSGNLHTLVGVEDSSCSMQGFLSKQIPELGAAVVQTPFAGLGLISGLADGAGAANPRPAQKGRLLSQLHSLNTEYVVLDVASGTGYNALDAFLAADVHIVVVQPEPTSVETAIRLVKCAFLRRLRGLEGLDQVVEAVEDPPFGIPTPQQLLQAASLLDHGAQDAIREAMGSFRPLLLVNKTRARRDLELGPALAVVCRRHLGLPLEYLGYVEHDDMVWTSVRNRRPLLVEYPEAKVGKDIERIARRVLAMENPDRTLSDARPTTLDDQNYYEILGIHPGATEAEVRAAERRVRRIYDEASPTIYGVVPRAEVEHMLAQVELAYAKLVDPEKSQLYIRSIFPDLQNIDNSAVAKTKAAAAVREGILPEPDSSAGPPREMPAITDTTIIDGPLLRAVREARGLELADLADHTKISISHLRAIEDENYINTPAPVYMRGFVRAVAKCLNLDPVPIVAGYMERYEAIRAADK